MKYTNKQIVELIKTRLGKPMLVREIMRQLRLTADDRHGLKQVLNELVLSGEIIKTRGNRYGLPEKMDLETGIFQAHPQGYGFDAGREEEGLGQARGHDRPGPRAGAYQGSRHLRAPGSETGGVRLRDSL